MVVNRHQLAARARQTLPPVSKTLARDVFNRVSGVWLARGAPYGVDPFADIAFHDPGFSPEILLDVGANIGQSAQLYREKFPASRIHCFEPVGAAFRELTSRFINDPAVHCHKLAVGDAESTVTMLSEGSSELNRVVNANEAAALETVEEVRQITLERFVAKHDIERVGYLKIDTEGHDLAVLEGAAPLFRDGLADFVQVEAGMNASNTRHIPFAELRAFLDRFNYQVFGLYEQTPEWVLGEPQLRRANVVFVSELAVARLAGSVEA